MCRPVADPKHYRCHCAGPTRSAKDRGRRAARAAAPVTSEPQPGVVAARPTEDAPAADEVRAFAADVAAAYDDADARETLAAQFGSHDRAIVAAGEAVAARAEQLAGITGDDVAALHDVDLTEAVGRMEAQRAQLGVDALRDARDGAQATYDALDLPSANDPENWPEIEAAQAPLDEARRALSEATRHPDLLAAEAEYDAAINGKGKRTADGLARLRDGYTAALAEVRDFGGPLGLDDEHSAPEAAAAFQDAAQRFPAAWVERSGQMRAPVARIADGRAHYSRDKLVEQKTRAAPKTEELSLATGDDATERDTPFASHSIDPRTTDAPAGRTWWVKTEYEAEFDSSRPRPAGDGWEQYTHRGASTWWRRPKLVEKRTGMPFHAPVILTSPDADATTALPGDGPYARAAVHELGHRMQHANPAIARAEHAYLGRRTTTATGEREKPVNLAGPNETGYADSFSVAYTGKTYAPEYGTPDDEGHTEVLSTGMEALFAGRYGGFIGAGQHHPDHETRSFILGLLATAPAGDK